MASATDRGARAAQEAGVRSGRARPRCGLSANFSGRENYNSSQMVVLVAPAVRAETAVRVDRGKKTIPIRRTVDSTVPVTALVVLAGPEGREATVGRCPSPILAPHYLRLC